MDGGSPWTVYRTRFLVRARQLTEPLVFTDALGREQSGQPGDYMVESSEGIKRITAKILFEDIYVPLSSAVPEKAVPEKPVTPGSDSRISRGAVSRTSVEHASGRRLTFPFDGVRHTAETQLKVR
jgi:hypothetical protein